MLAEKLDGAIGIDAIRSSTIGDILLVLWQFAELLLKILDRDRNRPRNMPRLKFQGRTGVKDDDSILSNMLHQLLHANGVRCLPIAEVLAYQAL